MNDPITPFNILIVAVTSYVSYLAFKHSEYRDKLVFDTELILRKKQYYRVVSSGFIHGDLMHLVFNMFSLYSFGLHIEKIYGAASFLIIYSCGVVGGNIVSLVIHRRESYRALGASGGVCGIIFASIFLLPGGEIIMYPIPVPIPSYIYAVIFILASYYGMRKSIGNIGHDAHLGGALVGLVVTTIMYPRIVTVSPILYSIVVLLSVSMIGYSNSGKIAHYLQRMNTNRIGINKKVKGDGNKPAEDEILDSLLTKVSQGGLESLNHFERKWLEQASKSKKWNS
jgi:membrane associated rhomboid family serine protease